MKTCFFKYSCIAFLIYACILLNACVQDNDNSSPVSDVPKPNNVLTSSNIKEINTDNDNINSFSKQTSHDCQYTILLNTEHDYYDQLEMSDYKFIQSVDEWNQFEPSLSTLLTDLDLQKINDSIISIDFTSSQLLYLRTTAFSGGLSFNIDFECESTISSFIGWCDGQGGDSAYHFHTMVLVLPKGDYSIKFDVPRQIECK